MLGPKLPVVGPFASGHRAWGESAGRLAAAAGRLAAAAAAAAPFYSA